MWSDARTYCAIVLNSTPRRPRNAQNSGNCRRDPRDLSKRKSSPRGSKWFTLSSTIKASSSSTSGRWAPRSMEISSSRPSGNSSPLRKKKIELGDSWCLHWDNAPSLFTRPVLSRPSSTKRPSRSPPSTLFPGPSLSGLLPSQLQEGAGERLHQQGLGQGGEGANMRPRSVGHFCCSFRSVDRETEEVRLGGGREGFGDGRQ